MKTTKIFALAIALIMVFALAACSDNGNNNTSGGSTNTPPPSETPSAPDTSTPSPNQTQGNGDNDPGNGDPDPGNGNDPGTTYGTIPMPEGFPENLGDAEFFNPVTDDYVLSDGRHGYFNFMRLVSYDEQGRAVQFVGKIIRESTPDLSYYDSIIGIEVVGNVIYYDFLKIYDEGEGMTDDDGGFIELEHFYRLNNMFPTKEGPVVDYGPPTGVVDLLERGYYYSKP